MKIEVVQRVREIADKKGGIEPMDVVEDAKDPASPLHDMFDWDVESAALKQWIDTARNIIRQIRFEVVTKNVSQPSVIAYVEDPDKPKGTQGYVSTIVVQNDKDKAERVLRQECERAEAAMRRVYKVADSLKIKPQKVETILAQIRGIRRAV